MLDRALATASFETLRELFPITRTGTAFFGHCTASPLAQPVVDAIHGVLEEHALHGAMSSAERIALRKRWRANAASLLGASADEIAYANNTVDAIHFVTSGIAWRPGDTVVTCDIEFPANVFPWLNLRERGVETRFVTARDGRLEADDVIAALDDHTRLVALSLVQFTNGQRIAAERIGAACRERGILFLLDAIQGLGAIPFDVDTCPVDFVCAGGHKWLLGPLGSGLFYCRRAVLDSLHVATLGHGSMTSLADMLAYRFELKPDASRFEGGAPNVLPQYGFDASLSLILGVGLARIHARIRELGDRLVAGLVEHGYRVHSPRTGAEVSGIVAFSSAEHDAASLTARLHGAGVIVTPACGLVRAAPHFYTSPDDVDRLLAALPHTA